MKNVSLCWMYRCYCLWSSKFSNGVCSWLNFIVWLIIFLNNPWTCMRRTDKLVGMVDGIQGYFNYSYFRRMTRKGARYQLYLYFRIGFIPVYGWPSCWHSLNFYCPFICNFINDGGEHAQYHAILIQDLVNIFCIRSWLLFDVVAVQLFAVACACVRCGLTLLLILWYVSLLKILWHMFCFKVIALLSVQY